MLTSQSPITSLQSQIHKPTKAIVPLAVGLSWQPDTNFLYQEKMDGQFATLRIKEDEFTICNLAGEQMPDGTFYAFDIVQYLGMDVRQNPLGQRHLMFNTIMEHTELPPHVRRVPESRHGGQFLADVLARGGEGVLRKHRDSKWSTPAQACKRLETFLCVVTGMNAGQSVQISRILELEARSENSDSNSQLLTPNSSAIPCGSVALFGNKCNQVRIGSLLKIEGFGLTAAGQIREPRPCKDTPQSWLIQY